MTDQPNRNIHSHPTEPPATLATAELVRRSAGAIIAAHPAPVSLEMDLPADVAIPVAPGLLAELVAGLVAQALERMPAGGELSITGWEGAHFYELEVADPGAAGEAGRGRVPSAATRAGVRLTWQDCPQGGTAVTARFAKAAPRRAA